MIQWFLMGIVNHSQSSLNSNFAMSLQYLKKEVDFLHACKYQSFLQVDFNTLGIKVSYKVILSLLMGMIKHCQSTQGTKFAIPLQHLKKEVRDWVHFLHADKDQSFYKLALLFLMEVARHDQSTQNRKLVILFQYLKVVLVVNIKLDFTDKLFCNLIKIIKWCKIQYSNLDKALLFLGNQVIWRKNWNFDKLQLP